MNTKNLYNILEELRATNSNKDKIAILNKNKNDVDLQKILEYTYNPHKRYGITDKTFDNSVKSLGVTYLREVFDLSDVLATSNINDELRRAVRVYVDGLEKHEAEIAKGLLTKDLELGLSSSTINKVWAHLVPKFEVQLAKKYSDVKLKENEKIFITEKLDGIRCLIVKKKDQIRFFTRQGKEIMGLDNIANSVKLKFGEDVVLDGELLAENPEGLNSGDLYRKTTKIVNSKSTEKNDVVFHVFDILTAEEFLAGKSKSKYSERRELLKSYFLYKLDSCNPHTNTRLIQLVPILYSGTDHSKVAEFLEITERLGKEGIMINRDLPYECKRTSSLLKVKSMNTCDLMIIGYLEGIGRNKGRLGAFIVDYKGHKVAVGSGYSDTDRDYFWSIKDQLIGRVAEVQYFEESSNENGGVSLRFPIFKEIREEGKEVSYN